MRKVLRIFAVLIQAAALIAAAISFSNFIEDKAKSAQAVEDASRANVFNDIGRGEFEEAERKEHEADTSASMDALELGTAVIALLLASGLWLLADISEALRHQNASQISENPHSEHGTATEVATPSPASAD